MKQKFLSARRDAQSKKLAISKKGGLVKVKVPRFWGFTSGLFVGYCAGCGDYLGDFLLGDVH